ncbi:hypothetical protein ACXET9_14995 [Brachybacterium sp. DNPG3]
MEKQHPGTTERERIERRRRLEQALSRTVAEVHIRRGREWSASDGDEGFPQRDESARIAREELTLVMGALGDLCEITPKEIDAIAATYRPEDPSGWSWDDDDRGWR